MLRSTAVLVLILASASGAVAQNHPGHAGAAIVRGQCSKLVVGGTDLSKTCSRDVASVTLADGTVTFIFSARGRMVGFQGHGSAVAPGAKGFARLPVSFVSIGTSRSDLDLTRASGSCEFQDPYAGRPAVVKCTARTAFGAVIGSFRSDGSAPRVR